jgi:hypothetical protein
MQISDYFAVILQSNIEWNNMHNLTMIGAIIQPSTYHTSCFNTAFKIKDRTEKPSPTYNMRINIFWVQPYHQLAKL